MDAAEAQMVGHLRSLGVPAQRAQQLGEALAMIVKATAAKIAAAQTGNPADAIRAEALAEAARRQATLAGINESNPFDLAKELAHIPPLGDNPTAH